MMARCGLVRQARPRVGESSKTGQQLIYQSKTNNYDDLDNAGASTAGEYVTAVGQGSGEPPRGPGNLDCYCDCIWGSPMCRCSNCYCGVRCRCTKRFIRRSRGPLKPPAHGCSSTRKIVKTNPRFSDRSLCYMRSRRTASGAMSLRRLREITRLLQSATTALGETADELQTCVMALEEAAHELQTRIRALSLERLPDTGYAIDGRGPDINWAERQGEHLADTTEDRSTLNVSDATDPVTSSPWLHYMRPRRPMALAPPPFPLSPNYPDYTPSFPRPIDEHFRSLTIRTPSSDSDDTGDRTVSEDWVAERAELEQAERERFQMADDNEVLESNDKDASTREESDSDVAMEEANDLDGTKEENDTE
ncbi:hypothetical protein SNK03_006769 [Fusarium graminearum]